ncbi:MAG: sensor histidine kinase [Acidobacteriota bacterium]
MKTRWEEEERLLAEGAPAAGSEAPELGLREWRQRMLGYYLWIAFGIGVPLVLYIVLIAPDFAPLRFRLFITVFLGLILLLALARRLDHSVRTWALLLVAYAFSFMMFNASGLQGGGRQVLLGVPLYAMIFLGPRSGWASAAVSLILYAAVAFLNVTGRMSPVFPDQRFSGPTFWFMQGAMLVLALVPILFLLTRFIGFLGGALAAERRSAAQLEAEALERRRLERVLLETGERERRAVGHQLHDGPCQQITAALLRCKVAENALAARGPKESAGHIRAIAQLLDASVGEIHDLARGLSPPELSPAALTTVLGDLARRVTASGSVACEFLHDGSAPPPDPVTTSQLVQIAQESVANAVRHARARHITIELAQRDQALRLVVRDDGAGVAPDAAGEGMGLRIMRHRAGLAGGTLTIGPAPGGGTAVTCTIPLPAEPANREAEA